jgi:plasmid stabilization system protein ParE
VTRVWFLPAALVDVETAFEWYEAERQGLGEEFVRAVQAALDRILEFPAACPVAHRDARRYLIERFPYCLYYREVGEGLVVVALLHAARDPELPPRRIGG